MFPKDKVLAAAAAVICGVLAFAGIAGAANINSGEIIDLTNIERRADGLGALVENSRLSDAAQAHAEDMANQGYFSHNSPDGVSPQDWMDEAGYVSRRTGENIALMRSRSADTESTLDGWMNSSGHRANILNSAYTEIGVGVATDRYQGSNCYFVVQMFGANQTSEPYEPNFEPSYYPLRQNNQQRYSQVKQKKQNIPPKSSSRYGRNLKDNSKNNCAASEYRALKRCDNAKICNTCPKSNYGRNLKQTNNMLSSPLGYCPAGSRFRM